MRATLIRGGCIIMAALLGYQGAAPVLGETYQAEPTDDTFIGPPEGPHGAETVLLFFDFTYMTRPLLKFDLSAIPDGAVITNAELHMWEFEQYGHTGGVNYLRRIGNDAWDEASCTWNTYDQSDWTTVASRVGVPSGATVWTLDIGAWNYGADLADDYLTLMVRFAEEGSGYYKQVKFHSKEAQQVERPYLSVTYVPEPASLWLLAFGALVAMRPPRR